MSRRRQAFIPESVRTISFEESQKRLTKYGWQSIKLQEVFISVAGAHGIDTSAAGPKQLLARLALVALDHFKKGT